MAESRQEIIKLRPVVRIGLFMLVLAAGLYYLTALTQTSHFSHAIVGLAISGLGIGLFVAPNNSALMGAAPRSRQGIAAGVLALARNVGMVLGIGLTGAIFTTVLNRGDPSAASTLVPARSPSPVSIMSSII